MTLLEKRLLKVAKTAAISIDAYIAGTWDGNIEGWQAISDALIVAMDGQEGD